MQTDDTVKVDDAPKVDVAPKNDETLNTVIEKINDADSILVTLSKDPTVDEMTAALGLTLMLDRYGKHVTAIYSGKTPNALEFLKPDETFEADTNSLQDFIIALNKEKADHLRYKIEGDFVKVYITPYKTTISENDLEFSRGEVNVDLIIAIDVIEAEDLDAALAQHGRIMHNASLVNVSNGAPGRLGGVEWNDAHASSVSEMIVVLLEQLGQTIPKDVATALLTGIVAATERFSNERTTPETMALASKLMQIGADQQLIVAQIMSAKPEMGVKPEAQAGEVEKKDDGALDVTHEDGISSEEQLSAEQQLEQMIKGNGAEAGVSTGSIMKELEKAVPEVSGVTEAPVIETPAIETPAILTREAPVMPTIETEAPIVGNPVTEVPTPVVVEQPVVNDTIEAAVPIAPAAETLASAVVEPQKVDNIAGISEFAAPGLAVEPDNNNMVASVPQSKVDAETTYGVDTDRTQMEDKTMKPLDDGGIKDYGAMIDNELGVEAPNPAIMAAPAAPVTPEVQPVAPEMTAQAMTTIPEAQPGIQPANQSLAQPVTDETPALPEVQPMMGGVELPPPPTPDTNNMMPPIPNIPEVPAMPEAPVAATPTEDNSAANLTVNAPTGVQVQSEPINPVVVQPDSESASVPPVQDPGAFKIPGM